MSFGGLTLTNKGKSLQAKCEAGAILHFNRISVGDGELGPLQIVDLNALIHQVKSLSITKLKAMTGGKAVIGTSFTNQDIATGFYWRELGIYAQDPDEGEILYCYGNAGGTAEYIPAGGGPDVLEKAIDIVALIGTAANVSATIDNSLIFATMQDLDGKVDKVAGKGLSTNDYTTEEKTKLAGLQNYNHPNTHPATMILMGDNTSVEVKVTSHIADLMPHQDGLNVYASSKDANGIYTIVDYKRADGILYMRSTLSNPDAKGNYQTDTWKFYDAQANVILTKTWALTYDEDGNIVSKVVA